MPATKIPYAEYAWNPVVGCTPIGAGCARCWSMHLHDKRHRAFKIIDNFRRSNLPKQYEKPFSEIQLLAKRLYQPLHWRKPRRIFVNSMSDTFHADVPIEFRHPMFEVMDATPQHTYLIFTKRFKEAIEWRFWPKNVYLYFSVSTQQEIDTATPYLIEAHAYNKGWSLEPLLGPISLGTEQLHRDHIIVGCESGPKRRPCTLEWIRGLHRQCKEAGVPCYIKQLPINRHHLRPRVSTKPEEWPEDLRVRELPK